MQKRWVIKEEGDATEVEALALQLGVSIPIANLLFQRNIKTFEEARSFFRPQLSDLHDPFLMKDMDLAINRIEKAISSNERILVYGDYDVDGTTAVSLVYTFLKKIHTEVEFYIPDRYKEGYGISFTGIDFAKENGFSLIIALDCGIKSIDKVDYALEKNIDFIICDHHRPGDTIPNAVAVLDPKREDCNYPYDELSGCGIGFKLIQAYAIKNNIDFSDLDEYLDLVVVSIASDIVPITGENRILAYYGLKRINSNPRRGFRSMLELVNVKKELTITDLVFIIGPRINAAGRIESGKKAVELLVSNNDEAAYFKGVDINVNNTERKNLDTLITQQALNIIEADLELVRRKSTVLFNAEWHKGVIGIVASRLIEKYYRPTIVLTESNGMITGSARSVKDFDVYDAIEACSDLLEQFGGHKYAAGLTMKPENLISFQQKFEEVVSKTIPEHLLTPEVEIDAKLEFSEIDAKFCRIIKQFAPFGPGNMAPVFVTENLTDKGYAKIVGSNHLKLDLKQGENPNSFSAIAFNLGEHSQTIFNKIPFNACYSIEENEWKGNVTIQLNIKDIQV